MKAFEADRPLLADLVRRLRAQGITDDRLLQAVASIPRRLFVTHPDRADAYGDRAAPIECGQTLPPALQMAQAVQALSLRSGAKVLEVGCGSGYQAAVLAHMGGRVVTLDRYRTLVELAEDRFQTLRLEGIVALVADGLDGFTRHAPYERIIVDGAVPKIPTALLDQLGEGGVMVIPVGEGATQTLTRVTREGRLFNRVEIATVRSLPLLEGTAARL